MRSNIRNKDLLKIHHFYNEEIKSVKKNKKTVILKFLL